MLTEGLAQRFALLSLTPGPRGGGEQDAEGKEGASGGKGLRTIKWCLNGARTIKWCFYIMRAPLNGVFI